MNFISGRVFVFCSLALIAINRPAVQKDSNTVFASHSPLRTWTVMELFTSQGCSSCPPADRLLGKYALDTSLITLSYHVDYWNNLGWKDPFSSSINSERQKKYGESLGLDGIYTPQLVINGQQEMVGNDEQKIIAALKGSPKSSSETILSITGIVSKDSKHAILYSVEGLPASYTAFLITVQRKAVTSILRGENQGKILINYNVVRALNPISVHNGLNECIVDQQNGMVINNYYHVILIHGDKNRIIAAAKINS